MPRQLVALLAGALLAAPALAPARAGDDLAAGLMACRSESGATARLACYDALGAAPSLYEATGAGSATTPAFDLAAPALLRFESRDAILVLYLLDASGHVVQNLHHAGVGEGTYRIERPGSYHLQIDASGGWRIRVEAP